MLNPVSQPALDSSYVLVAGVPWPRHKLFAVLAGIVSLIVLSAITASAAPSVLGAAGVAVAVSLVLKLATYRRD